MKYVLIPLLALSGFACCAFGQEAEAGIDVRATVTGQAAYSKDLGEAPRNGADWVAGFRSVLYPTVKLNEHWSVSGAVQAVSRPYYYNDFTSTGYGVRARVLQANVSYSRVWKNGSVVIRAGQLLSASARSCHATTMPITRSRACRRRTAITNPSRRWGWLASKRT